MSKTYTTAKGSVLPIMALKGKDYMMIAYRLIWLVDECPNYTIDTSFSLVTDEQTVAHATVTIYDTEGKVIKKASATKRETKKEFSDHTEKAETSAVGRCLAMLGFGTQFAVADLDEGNRLADSPLAAPPSAPKTETVEEVKKPSFARKSYIKKEEKNNSITVQTDGTIPVTNTGSVITATSAVTETDAAGWE